MRRRRCSSRRISSCSASSRAGSASPCGALSSSAWSRARASSSARLGACPTAMRRPSAPRMERTMERLLGVPSCVKPARCDFHSGLSPICVRSRCGRARSSKKSCRNSSLLRVKLKSSSPSPESLACPPPEPPAPPAGRAILSPCRYSVLPGWTVSRAPPRPCWNKGSPMSLRGMVMFSERSMSRMPRLSMARRTASRTCSL